MGRDDHASNIKIKIVSPENTGGEWVELMKYTRKNLEDRKSCCTIALIINALFSIVLLQASVTCETGPRLAHASTAPTASPVSCVDPVPPNTGISAPPAPATPGIVVINEVLSSPQSEWNCTTPDGKSPEGNAWIEIYNPQDQPLDLYAAHASIDQGEHTQPYILLFGSIITAHGFLVIFPFTNLTPLSSIRLTISTVVIDEVSPPPLAPDTSYARLPDGSDDWQIMTTPTIRSSNTISSNTTSSNPPTPRTKATGGRGTSTPTHTTKQKSTKTQNDGTDTANPGVQPTWSALRLPSSESNNAPIDNTTQNNAPSSTSLTDSFGLFNKILLTLLIVVLPFALLWCWRFYKKRYAKKARS
jgi:hypothetical protein